MSEVTPPQPEDPDTENETVPTAEELEQLEPGASEAPEVVLELSEPTELELITAERDEWMDRAQRIAADFENYRRRLATQRTDEIDRATGRLAEALLPVLDACEAAFLQHPAEIEPLFNLMLSELKKQAAKK